MSITSDRIREHGFIHALADDAADEIEDLEKAYELLFKENSDNRKRIAELESEVERLKACNANFPTAPILVFDRGPWILRDTGQRFTGSDLDEAAFVSYRTAMKGGE